MHLEYQVYEADFVNAGAASSAIKKTLKQLNVSPQIVKRVVVALYEAEVNAIAHAYGGMIYADIEPDKIILKVEDKGPGIPDIDWAMQPTSTGPCRKATPPHRPRCATWASALVWVCRTYRRMSTN